MRRLIILTIGCLLTQSIYAQEKKNTFNHRDRYIISEALLFLDQYEIDDIWRGNGNEGVFRELFSSTATVVNDIPAANSQKTVSLDTYINQLTERVFSRSKAVVRLYPYSISLNESDASNMETGSGDVFIALKKTIRFKSPNDKRVNYRDTLSQNFHLKYTYVEDDISFKIQQISSNEVVGKYIVVKYDVKGLEEEELQREFGNVIVQSNNGIQRKKDSYGVFALNDFSDQNDYKVYSENTLFFQKKSIARSFQDPPAGDTIRKPSNISELRFRKKAWSISPELNYEWRTLNSQSTSFGSDLTSNVSQISYGLFLGKRLLSKVDQSLTLNIGGGMSLLETRYEITPFTSTSAEIDDAGDSYTRITRTKRLIETGQAQRRYLSFSLEYNRRRGTTEVGLFTRMNYFLSDAYNYATDATAKYSGLYGPEYFNILIDDPGHYYFGEHTVYIEDQAALKEELNVVYGLSVLQDLNRRIQLGVSFGFNTITSSPFGEENNLSTILYEFQSIQELDAQLWNDRFMSNISIIYFL